MIQKQPPENQGRLQQIAERLRYNLRALEECRTRIMEDTSIPLDMRNDISQKADTCLLSIKENQTLVQLPQSESQQDTAQTTAAPTGHTTQSTRNRQRQPDLYSTTPDFKILLNQIRENCLAAHARDGWPTRGFTHNLAAINIINTHFTGLFNGDILNQLLDAKYSPLRSGLQYSQREVIASSNPDYIPWGDLYVYLRFALLGPTKKNTLHSISVDITSSRS